MKKNINIKKISTSVSSVFNKDTAKLNIYPYVDWWIIVILFFVLTFAVSVFSYSIFIDIYSKDVYTLDELVRGDKYGQEDNNSFREDLERLLQFYDRKQEKLDAMRHQGVPQIDDPSQTLWIVEDEPATELDILPLIQ